MKRLYILIVWFFINTIFYSQVTYYVSNSGKNNNNGLSETSTWNSIDKVNSMMGSFNPGDKILFKRGDVFGGSKNLEINCNGSPNNLITFGSYGSTSNPLPVLNGSSILNQSTEWAIKNSVYSKGTNIKITELQIITTYYKNTYNKEQSTGLLIEGDNTEVSYCTFTSDLGSSIHEKGASNGITVSAWYGGGKNMNIHHNNIWDLITALTIQGNKENSDHATGKISYNSFKDCWSKQEGSEGEPIRIIANGLTSGLDYEYELTIDHNKFEDWGENCIDLNSVSRVIVEYNVMEKPKNIIANDNGSLGSAAMKAGGEWSFGTIIRYNIFRNLRKSTSDDCSGISTSGSSSMYIYGNLFYDIEGYAISINGWPGGLRFPGKTIYAFYNTIHSDLNGIVAWNSHPHPDLDIRNNIVVNYNLPPIQISKTNYCNNNLTNKKNRLNEYSSIYSGGSDNITNINPDSLFVDFDNGNFEIRKNSRAVNLAQTIAFDAPDGDPINFYSIDGNQRDANPDIGAYESSANDDDEDSTFSPTNTEGLKVLLEAPFIDENMEVNLNFPRSFPLDGPYSSAPWNITDSRVITFESSKVVDWVVLELRTNQNTSSYIKPGLLLRDGNIVNHDGSNAAFDNIQSGQYYIVIYHRNHLSIMSSNKVQVNNNVPIGYDFTDAPSKAYGDKAMIVLTNGNYGMFAGDGDANGVINNLDFGTVANKIPYRGYEQSDLDMNGVINVLDYSFINRNILKKSNVPERIN